MSHDRFFRIPDRMRHTVEPPPRIRRWIIWLALALVGAGVADLFLN